MKGLKQIIWPAVAGVFLLITTQAPAALAGVGPGQPCAHGGNPTSTACENGRNGETYIGAYDNFTDLSMKMDSAGVSGGNHINNEMWFYTHHNESQWVEFGIREGSWPGNGTCNCGYGRFWADFNSQGQEFRHLIQFVSNNNGSNHNYEIIRNPNNLNNWDVWLDFNKINTSTNQNSSTGYEAQMGLEDSLVTPDSSSSLFNHSPLEYMAPSGTFFHFSYQARWEDFPCASNPPGYCLHFASNANDVYEDAKQ